MNAYLRRLSAAVPLLLLVFPLIALAQTGLVPCGTQAGYMNATNCNLCSFGQLIQNIINYMVALSIPLSAALFAWAGILYFTSAESTARVEKAHKILTSVFIGFVIAISAWLVVQTILSVLVKGTFWIGGSWNDLQCVDNSQRPRDKTIVDLFGSFFNSNSASGTNGQSGVTVGQTPGGSTPVVAGATESDQAARDALAASCQSGSTCFTYTSSGNCSDQNNSNCTSLNGIQQGTIDQLIALQRDCGCTINITGGTETGHGGTSDNVHTQGAAVDFSKNPQVDSIIQNLGSPTTVSANGAQDTAYRAQNGVLYIDEGSHWHLQIPTTSA